MSLFIVDSLAIVRAFRRPIGSFQKGLQSDNLLLNPRTDMQIGRVTATIKLGQLT